MQNSQPVEVAHWLLPWWDFWSGVTGALWWPAWSAIFSVSALLMTIMIASRSERERRGKDAVFLRAAAQLIVIVRHCGRNALDESQTHGNLDGAYRKLGSFLEKMRTFAAIEEVKLSEFPNTDTLIAWVAFQAGLTNLNNIIAGPEHAHDRSAEYFSGLLHDMDACHDVLVSNARTLERGTWRGILTQARLLISRIRGPSTP